MQPFYCLQEKHKNGQKIMSRQLKLTDMIASRPIPLQHVLQQTKQPPTPQLSLTPVMDAWFEPTHLPQAIVWPPAQLLSAPRP